MFLLNFTLFIRIFAILVIVLSPYKLFSKNIDLKYEIEWNTLHIANLSWISHIEDQSYTIKTKIVSEGLFERLYPFELNSLTSGNVIKNNFLPTLFEYNSQTKKKNKKVKVVFDNLGVIEDYNIIPEPEDTFINNFEAIVLDKYFIDPISQLFQYFLYQSSSGRTVIDGRRIYTLKANDILGKRVDFMQSLNFDEELKGIKITFPYYLSLWKDSKDDANKMNYIEFYYQNINNNDIPIQIIVKTKRVKVFMNLISYNIGN